jgi:hypothetical protein
MVYAGKQRLLRKQTRPPNVLTQMLMNVKSTFSNLEHEYVQKLTKDLADEIDFNVLGTLLVDSGWTRVELPRFSSRFHSIDIDIWIEQNCSGYVKSFGSKFLFEKSKDATLFILRWS